MKRATGRRAAVAGVVLMLSAAAGTASEPAAAVVEALHAALSEAMVRGPELRFEGRYRLLEPRLRESFDFPGITRIAVGPTWRELGREEREELAELFARVSVATYAARFRAHAGESFRVLATEDLRRGRKLVRSVLVKKGGGEVHFDYVLEPAEDGGWQIVNVVVDGVSDLSLKRAEYGSVLDAEGLPGLLARLRAKLRELREGGGE